MLIVVTTEISFADSTTDGFDIIVGPLGAPTNFTLALSGSDVQINWVKDIAADTTLVRRKQDSYPTGILDGTEVYNSTGESYLDGGVTIGNNYYYRAWSFNSTAPSSFSVEYAEDHILVLEPALFDIRNILILDSVVPTISIICTVENAGGVIADITVSWWLNRTDTGASLDIGSDTFAVSAGSEVIYQIFPSTTYVGLCSITFSGYNASSSQLFITQISGGGGGGGSSGGGYVPSAADSDGDGLTDAEEIFYGTDPYKSDTDGDGYSDYYEIHSGTNPLDPNSPPVSLSFYFMVGVFALICFSFMLIWFFAKKKKEKEEKSS